jgi:hypothetical protein
MFRHDADRKVAEIRQPQGTLWQVRRLHGRGLVLSPSRLQVEMGHLSTAEIHLDLHFEGGAGSGFDPATAPRPEGCEFVR